MRIAFHAPMKPPDHPVPSGDRRMARMLLTLLADLGHEVALASRFRSYEGRGDPDAQRAIANAGDAEARRLIARCRREPATAPELWFTYHLYHKAPDHLGPKLAASLGIPYLVAEASTAAKQARGPWAAGFTTSLEALRRADLILAMTARDAEGLRECLGEGAAVGRLRPFLDPAPFAAAAARKTALRRALLHRLGLDPEVPLGLAVAMMRQDVKHRSYRFLAEALSRLDHPLQMVVVGDGPGREEVAGWFANLPLRSRFLGRLSAAELPGIYAACDLYLWPGFGEAYGIAYLEAQAAGLPVVALDTPGVAEVVADGASGILVGEERPEAFAAAVRRLLDEGRRRAAGTAAQRHVRTRHGLDGARATLAAALEEAVAHHRRRMECPRCGS